MSAVEFNAVVSRLHTTRRRMFIALHDLPDSFRCYSRQLLSGKFHIVDHQHLCSGVKCGGNGSLPQLDRCFSAVLVDGIRQLLMPLNQAVITDGHKVCRCTGRMYRSYLHNV